MGESGDQLRPACPPTCGDHREHVYILCYGRPVVVSSRDYVTTETEFGYPIDHYVGYTRQQPPVNRIRSHGNRSAHHIAHIQPGNEWLEHTIKATWRCPRCDGSLWYFRAPNPMERR